MCIEFFMTSVISLACDYKNSFLDILYPMFWHEINYFENNVSTRSNQGLVTDETHKIFPDGETEHFVSSSTFILSYTIDIL